MRKVRKQGDRYRPIVTIDKVKKEVPSVVTISGFRYIRDDAQRSISKKNWNRRKESEGWKSKDHYKRNQKKEDNQ